MAALKQYGTPLSTTILPLHFIAHVFSLCNFSLLIGGIYLDTDAYPIAPLDSLRVHEFTMTFDNIVNPDRAAPKRLNNGVIATTASSPFLDKWITEYQSFDPSSWAKHSSEIPYSLATLHPDLIHIEWSRMSPISFGFQTSEAAVALTCGIYDARNQSIIYPRWNTQKRIYNFDSDTVLEQDIPNHRLFQMLTRKLVLHLTMTGARYSFDILNNFPNFKLYIFILCVL